MRSALSIFVFGGHFGFPVSHGSKTIRLPPGVTTTKVAWPSHVIASEAIGQYNIWSFVLYFSIQHSAFSIVNLPPDLHRRPQEASGRAAGAAEARVAQGPCAGVGELPSAEGLDALAGAAHGLRGSQLPQHRRVLASWHRDVHDSRRHVHALVRVLQRHA